MPRPCTPRCNTSKAVVGTLRRPALRLGTAPHSAENCRASEQRWHLLPTLRLRVWVSGSAASSSPRCRACSPLREQYSEPGGSWVCTGRPACVLARREAPEVPEMWTLSSSGNQKQQGLQGEDTGAWSWDSASVG